MTDSVPVALGVALLVVLSLPAMTVGGVAPETPLETGSTTTDAPALVQPADPFVEIDGSPNRLALDTTGEYTSSLGTPSPDLGTVFATSDESLERDFEWHRFERTFVELSENEQDAAADDLLADIEARFDALHEREQAVVAAHAAGEVSDGELFRELARHSSVAADISTTADRLIDLAELHPDPRSEWYDLQVDVYESPIRTAITDAVEGGSYDRFDAITIESTDTGLTLQAIDDDTYVRETTRYDHRDTSLDDEIGGLSEAVDLAAEYYPWAFDDASGSSSNPSEPLQLYRVGFSHTQGQLSVFLDGGTQAVYHEQQELTLAEVPLVETATATGEATNVTVDRSATDSPLRVSVTDLDDDPQVGNVSVDDVAYGQTVADGTLWIAPPQDATTITVETDAETLEISI